MVIFIVIIIFCNYFYLILSYHNPILFYNLIYCNFRQLHQKAPVESVNKFCFALHCIVFFVAMSVDLEFLAQMSF